MSSSSSSYRPLEQLTLEEYERVSEEYRLYKQCAHCGQRFRRAENVGQFQCRLHPGVMRYDFYRYGEFYSCCGGDARSPGCRPADHLDRALDLERDDETQRHEQLFEQAFAVVPTGLYGFGLMPPQRECTVWHSARATEKRSACFATSFNAELEERFVFSEVAHEVSESVRDSPVLLRTLGGHASSPGQVGGRADALRRIEAGWCSVPGQDMDTDDEDAQRRRRAHQRPDYHLPYVIVKCIG
jgi:hypothetical protein